MKKEIKKETVLIVSIFFLIPLASASVAINEIMPNPDDECSDCTEWIEFYSDKEINLTGFILDTTGQSVVLNTTVNGFLIITGNKTKFLILWPINESKVIEWKNIGLVNSGDNVSLYNNSILVSNTVYSSFSGSSNQNKIWARCNGNWSKYNMPTPGLQNNCTQHEEQEDQEESKIKIIDAPTRAEFGETIEVEIDVYKGDTSKYAVYIYAEDEDENKISNKVALHFKTKFSSQTAVVELELKCKDEIGNYEIVAEGLDTEDREEIDLDSCYEFSDSDDNATTTIGDFSYSLTIPNTINLNENFTVRLKIASKAEQEQNFLVWSYVFRGSKCYSCLDDETRESNAKSITILPGLSVDVEIENKVEEAEAEPGIYKLKIKALQEGLKTPKEFTYDIQIKAGQIQGQTQESVIEQAQQTEQTQTNQADSMEFSGITGAIIESKSFSISKALPYILASLCALLSIYIIVKKI